MNYLKNGKLRTGNSRDCFLTINWLTCSFSYDLINPIVMDFQEK